MKQPLPHRCYRIFVVTALGRLVRITPAESKLFLDELQRSKIAYALDYTPFDADGKRWMVIIQPALDT